MLASSAKGSPVTAGGEEERVPVPPGCRSAEYFFQQAACAQPDGLGAAPQPPAQP